MSHLFADDILATLRLVKAGRPRSSGVIQYVDSWLLEGGTNFVQRSTRSSDRGDVVLETGDVEELRTVWMALTGRVLQTKRFIAASLRRFNMAADRDSVEDSIVDLMIASESLFLSEVAAPADRGELSFRFAQRAALIPPLVLLQAEQVIE